MSDMRNDPVNHPSHYTQGKIECIDFITDKGLNFCRGNAVKYIVRAGLKDKSKEIEDLEKAVFYIRREIEDLRKVKDEAAKLAANQDEDERRRLERTGGDDGRLWMVDMAAGFSGGDGR